MATFYFIKNNFFTDTLKLAELFLTDKEDLIQKATGWMLREVGKKQEGLLLDFLFKHHKEMPRIMLRYSLEKLTPEIKVKYLKKKVAKKN